MDANWVGALLSFLVGVGIGAICYAISRYMLLHHPRHYAVSDVARRIIQVGFLVAVFFLGDYTPWDKLWLLVGGGLGITLPMIWFTYRLVKLNDSLSKKGDEQDG